jgi:hypothetical protein
MLLVGVSSYDCPRSTDDRCLCDYVVMIGEQWDGMSRESVNRNVTHRQNHNKVKVKSKDEWVFDPFSKSGYDVQSKKQGRRRDS